MTRCMHCNEAMHHHQQLWQYIATMNACRSWRDGCMSRQEEGMGKMKALARALDESWQDEVAMLNAGDDVGCLHLSGMLMKEKLATTLEK
eukprot:scaffold45338_cov26-Tisochrysis_lutea.AAC.1